ncbi:hypothetical protein DNTS_030072 [Danionella cerebrum]|uniref:Interferon gamma n=1 Tax=Danionella cerebrum TaxID=2873325 RepID=A0A553QSP9_9TELE|nr:hypothetical protein DNTS_030072 [Danionella translucida]
MDSCITIVLLLCGLLSTASVQTTNALRFQRSKSGTDWDALINNVTNLKNHYKANGPELVGRSVFVSNLEQLDSMGPCTCQSLLLDGMLNVYEEIFHSEMEKPEQIDVKTIFEGIIHEVKRLRHRFREEQKTWRELQKIHALKVKNETIQRALNDFNMVFFKAYTKKQR